MKNSFVIYTDYLEKTEKMSMEQRGVLFTALLKYVSGMELPEMDDRTDMAFCFIKPQIDKDIGKYEDKIKKRSEAGKQGGRPKANAFSEKQTKANKANAFFEKQNNPVNDNVNDNVNVNDKDNKKTLCKADANALFERLWKLYPLKRGKGAVSEANKRRLLDIGFAEMTRAIDRYKADLANETWLHPKNGSTFFNSGYIDYLDANYEKHAPVKSGDGKFCDFNQRDYDFAKLEARLLGGN